MTTLDHTEHPPPHPPSNNNPQPGPHAPSPGRQGGGRVSRLQLTFDDGPQPVSSALTPILRLLDGYGVKAIFFVLGSEVQQNRWALTSIIQKGHFIGNHTWAHEVAEKIKDDKKIYDAYKRCHDEVKAASGISMLYWRAPELSQPRRVTQLIVHGNPKLYSMSHCDVHGDSKDAKGASPTAKIMLDEIHKSLQTREHVTHSDGSMSKRLLFHVTPNTAKHLKTVLDSLRQSGYTFVDFYQQH
ncbi:MAG: polysaccharide deacetylase family protein [Magnetococcus sp. YQC-3]